MSKSSSETQGQKKSKELWEELFSPFFTFFCAVFFYCPFRLSLAPTICPWVSEDVWKSHTVFLLLSHAFGIEKISTFVHSRRSLENHTWFQTKMNKVYTSFQIKRRKNPTLWCGTYLYGIYKGVSPGSWSLKKYHFRAEPKILDFMPNSRLFFGPLCPLLASKYVIGYHISRHNRANKKKTIIALSPLSCFSWLTLLPSRLFTSIPHCLFWNAAHPAEERITTSVTWQKIFF